MRLLDQPPRSRPGRGRSPRTTASVRPTAPIRGPRPPMEEIQHVLVEVCAGPATAGTPPPLLETCRPRSLVSFPPRSIPIHRARSIHRRIVLPRNIPMDPIAIRFMVATDRIRREEIQQILAGVQVGPLTTGPRRFLATCRLQALATSPLGSIPISRARSIRRRIVLPRNIPMGPIANRFMVATGRVRDLTEFITRMGRANRDGFAARSRLM